MKPNSYTLVQRIYNEPGIATQELARVLHEAEAGHSLGGLRKKVEDYAKENKLLIDMKELDDSFEGGARYLVLVSTVPEIVEGAQIPINRHDLERALEEASNRWHSLLVKSIKEKHGR